MEITLEANPENITKDLMAQYLAAGINRVSIGVQTLDDGLLTTLGRTHSSQKAISAVEQTAAAGFKNISIDLMYDLPNQSLSVWEGTLDRVAHLPIDHLSLYNLTIEPHTVFFKHRDRIAKIMPSEEISLMMYETAIQKLNAMGLHQYEISAFAKPGFHSKHNTGYWTARPFLGFGPSAFSYWEGARFRNIPHLNRYHKKLEEGESPVDFSEKLDETAARRELLAVQIRLKEGVDLTDFQKKNGKMDSELVKTIADLETDGFITRQDTTIKLTHRGVLFYDTVATEIV